MRRQRNVQHLFDQTLLPIMHNATAGCGQEVGCEETIIGEPSGLDVRAVVVQVADAEIALRANHSPLRIARTNERSAKSAFLRPQCLFDQQLREFEGLWIVGVAVMYIT